MLFKLALKNIFSKKSSFVIILFIAFAIMLLVVTNSVFDSTEHGIQEAYVSSFTGDIVIRPKNGQPLSLFGDETPVTGKLSDMPTILSYADIKEYLSENQSINHIVPQFTGPAQVESDDEHIKAFLFGVNGDDYIECMSSITILEGEPYHAGEKGVMVSAKNAEYLGVKIGDTLQFAVEGGFSSRLRAAPVTAIYSYSVENSIMDRIFLVDPETVKSLLGVSDVSSDADLNLSDYQQSILDTNDIDDWFSDVSDYTEQVVTDAEPVDFSVTEPTEEELAAKREFNSSVWNFIICRVNEPRLVKKMIKDMNRYFKSEGYNVEAVNWRSSAGSMAFYLYLLRLILNIGIIVVLAAGFIVVNNTLVVNVLDRIREIGTLRAIGGTKRFVSAECMTETFILAIIAGILGCILGCFASIAVTGMHITFHNSFLIQLFGSKTLVTAITLRNLFNAFLLSIVIGFIAWIYPVYNALKINPVTAMQGAK